MKFLADMGISMRTVLWLRSNGYDTVHLREQGRIAYPIQISYKKRDPKVE